jgi:hypothetical protein
MFCSPDFDPVVIVSLLVILDYEGFGLLLIFGLWQENI